MIEKDADTKVRPEDPLLTPDIDWFWVAKNLLERANICWQQRKVDGPRYVNIWCEDRSPVILQELWKRLRIGPEPHEVLRYVRRDGTRVMAWRWVLSKQIEVYWLLQNVRRFVRGQWAARIEEGMQHIESNLSVHGRLRHFTFREAHESGALKYPARPSVRRFPRRVSGR